MLRIAAIFVVGSLYLPFTPVPVVAQDAATVPQYEIMSDAKTPPTKRSVDVRLQSRVSESVLRSIALRIKSGDTRTYQRTFILYYLPDMELGAGAWASSHYNPELAIQIFGMTAEQFDEATTARAPDEARVTIGTWIDDRPFVASRIVLFRKDGLVFIEHSYSDGSSGVDEVVETDTGAGARFGASAVSEDFYLINKDGNLELRDSEGLISIAKKVE